MKLLVITCLLQKQHMLMYILMNNLIGLYSCIQSVDDDFTNENFYERRGPLFEVETNLSISGCSGQIRFSYFLDVLIATNVLVK